LPTTSVAEATPVCWKIPVIVAVSVPALLTSPAFVNSLRKPLWFVFVAFVALHFHSCVPSIKATNTVESAEVVVCIAIPQRLRVEAAKSAFLVTSYASEVLSQTTTSPIVKTLALCLNFLKVTGFGAVTKLKAIISVLILLKLTQNICYFIF